MGSTSGPHEQWHPAVLQADAPAIDGFHDVLANLLGAIRANWQPTIADTDPEFLHELRVALRRTRSVLQLGKGVLSAPLRDTFGSQFGWLAGLTGPTRDLDAYLLDWDSSLSGLDDDVVEALAVVHDHLQRERAATFSVLRTALESHHAGALIADWSDELWASPRQFRACAGADAEHVLGDVIAARLRRTHHAVVRGGRSISSHSPSADLHDLRKDAKRLRYLVECFAGLFPAKPLKTYVRTLKGLQDTLGEHQDAVVHAAMLRDLLDDAPPEDATLPSHAIELAIAALELRQGTTRHDFAERFDDFDSDATRALVHTMRAAITPS